MILRTYSYVLFLALMMAACNPKATEPAAKPLEFEPDPVKPQAVAQVPPKPPKEQPKPNDKKGLKTPEAFYDPPEPGEGNWRPSKVPAVELAKKVEAKVAGLKGVSWYWRIFGEMPEGTSKVFGEGMIVGPSKFRYEYPVFGTKLDEYIAMHTWIADGKSIAKLSRQGVTDPKPVKGYSRTSTVHLVRDFPLRLGELFFAPVGSNQRPLTAFLTAVAKPGSRYKVTTEDRSLLHEGRIVNNSRVFVSRPMNKAKGVSALDLEMVFNANYHLPVSATVREVLPNGKRKMYTWGAKWNLDKGQTFDEKKFVIPAGPF